MSELTSNQIRETRDALLATIDKLNDLLVEEGDTLTAEEIKEINKATRRLSNGIAELTAKAIEGTAKELNRAVEGIVKATKNANDALDRLDDIRAAIGVVTAVAGLGSAITTGNPAGIISAAKGVLGAVSQLKGA